MGIRKNTGKYAVNGTSIYDPSTVVIENDNIVSSDTGRTESGYMYITWIRPTVRKIKLTYDFITAEEVSVLHNLMQGKEFTFSYEDNGAKTMRAYAGKDSYSQKNLNLYWEFGGLYSDYSIDIIEM